MNAGGGGYPDGNLQDCHSPIAFKLWRCPASPKHRMGRLPFLTDGDEAFNKLQPRRTVRFFTGAPFSPLDTWERTGFSTAAPGRSGRCILLPSSALRANAGRRYVQALHLRLSLCIARCKTVKRIQVYDAKAVPRPSHQRNVISPASGPGERKNAQRILARSQSGLMRRCHATERDSCADELGFSYTRSNLQHFSRPATPPAASFAATPCGLLCIVTGHLDTAVAARARLCTSSEGVDQGGPDLRGQAFPGSGASPRTQAEPPQDEHGVHRAVRPGRIHLRLLRHRELAEDERRDCVPGVWWPHLLQEADKAHRAV